MKPIVLFGIGKIADVAFAHILRDRSFEVIAFTCDRDWLPAGHHKESTHLGRPLVPFEEIEGRYPPAEIGLMVAIGYHNLNAARKDRCAAAKAMGYGLVSYVSPRADAGDWLEIGENCMVLDGVGIQPGARIGNNVSIWNNVLIGHHASVEDDCWIAAGATLGGMARLGARSFVGLGATIAGEVSVGEDSVLGANCLVSKAAPDKSVFIEPGTPRFRLDSSQFIRMTSMSAIGGER